MYASLYTPDLLSLDLGDLKNLTSLDPLAFGNLKSLKQLYLDNSGLQNLPNFSSNKNLEILDLSNNRIKSITSHDFTSQALLKYLDLSYNPISFISEGSFVGLESLIKLSLKSTNLTSFPENALGLNQQLKNIDFSLNKWTCDCTAKWMARWVRRNMKMCKTSSKTQPSPDGCPVCFWPAELKNQGMVWLEKQGKCRKLIIETVPTEVVPNTKIITAKLGESKDIICNQKNNRQEEFTWKRPGTDKTWNSQMQEIQTSNFKARITVNGSNLTISSVKAGDAGRYDCIYLTVAEQQ